MKVTHTHTVPFQPRQPIQPKPLSTHVAYHQGATAISRIYALETIKNCTNCPKGECTAGDHGMCLKIVPYYVPPSQAASFRFTRTAGDGRDTATG